MDEKIYNNSTHIDEPNIGTPFLKECFYRSMNYHMEKYNLSRLDMYENFSAAIKAYIEKGRNVENEKNKRNINYFLKILRNKVVNFIKEKEKQNELKRNYINEQIAVATELLKVSQEKLNNLVHRMIQDNNLPKHCTKILEAIFNKLKEGKEYNEISNKELAEQLDFTLNYLRSRKSYCLQETKKQYINDPIIQELYYQ